MAKLPFVKRPVTKTKRPLTKRLLVVPCLLVGSESRSGAVPGDMQKPWQLVGEVPSFADLCFAKTDFSGVGVGDSLFGKLAVRGGVCLVRGDKSAPRTRQCVVIR